MARYSTILAKSVSTSVASRPTRLQDDPICLVRFRATQSREQTL